ncbi:hypothetical protein ZHAWSFBX_CDS_0003 [Agrobacterium phage Alfirin]|nr:hypothetical protein ZHAWSFBX_CDS_0003 [Agrobacterium phage Alfirin]
MQVALCLSRVRSRRYEDRTIRTFDGGSADSSSKGALCGRGSRVNNVRCAGSVANGYVSSNRRVVEDNSFTDDAGVRRKNERCFFTKTDEVDRMILRNRSFGLPKGSTGLAEVIRQSTVLDVRAVVRLGMVYVRCHVNVLLLLGCFEGSGHNASSNRQGHCTSRGSRGDRLTIGDNGLCFRQRGIEVKSGLFTECLDLRLHGGFTTGRVLQPRCRTVEPAPDLSHETPVRSIHRREHELCHVGSP